MSCRSWGDGSNQQWNMQRMMCWTLLAFGFEWSFIAFFKCHFIWLLLDRVYVFFLTSVQKLWWILCQLELYWCLQLLQEFFILHGFFWCRWQTCKLLHPCCVHGCVIFFWETMALWVIWWKTAMGEIWVGVVWKRGLQASIPSVSLKKLTFAYPALSRAVPHTLPF